MEIKKATDWQQRSISLRNSLHSVGYNPDLQKMYQNIETMISELSKAEVIYRRVNNRSMLNKELEKINNAIDHLEKLILMAQLMR